MHIGDPAQISKFAPDMAKINNKCESLSNCCEENYKEEAFAASKEFGKQLILNYINIPTI